MNQFLISRKMKNILLEKDRQKLGDIASESGCELSFQVGDGVMLKSGDTGDIVEFKGTTKQCTDAFCMFQEKIMSIEKAIKGE